MAQINKPNTQFSILPYSGTNTSTSYNNGLNMSANGGLVWIKPRVTGSHGLWDSVRGATNYLSSNKTDMQSQVSGLTSFDTTGFTLGVPYNDGSPPNTFVSWSWLGGGTAVSNTDGNITSTVSANQTSGFSIITFNGTQANGSVGHGLGATPSMFILRRYTDDGYAIDTEWYTYHQSLGGTKYLTLQTTTTQATNDGSLWNTSTPATSSVINIGFNANSNNTGTQSIIYAFAEKKGFSKFGKYVANGSADGTFVYTGFKPAFILTKPIGNVSSFNISDTKRSTYNDGTLERVRANSSLAEDSPTNYDILSNGFKIRTTDNDYNPSGFAVNEVIYMAIAESPLVGTNNIPTTAR